MNKINVDEIEGLGVLLRTMVDAINDIVDEVKHLDDALLELKKETE